VAPGSGEVFPIVSAAFTGRVKVPAFELLSESVTVTEMDAAPESGGVPVRKPLAVSVSQLGKEVAVQVYMPVPPEALN
jgi:hypothetical protein